MIKYLNQHLPYKVRMETTRDFNSFWANVAQKRYDLVHFNQNQYLIAHAKFGYQIILKNEEFGSSSIASIIVARKDSGINTLQDLKGKKIAFGGDDTAMMSFLIPKRMLQDAGLPATSYISDFARNPPNALMAVYIGRADACGIGDAVLKSNSMAQRINLDELKIIAQSNSYPHLAWAVNDSMDETRKTQITALLLDLNNSSAGKAILGHAQMTGIQHATHAEYSPLLKYME